MKLVVAIVKPFKLDDVKAALLELGVTGDDRDRRPWFRHASAVTPRSTEVPSTRSTSFPSRGSKSWSSDEDADRVVNGLVEAARTGKIGDGKIWVLAAESVLRIRTGEVGEDAL